MILTPEQFAEHNKKILSSKKEDETHSGKKDIEKGIEKVMEFFQDMEDLKKDMEEIETEIESKSDASHTHDEFGQITDKFNKIKDSITNISDEIKNVKSSIKHYDDNPVLERINTIQEEVKTLEERVSGIKIPEIDLTGFLKEKDIKNLVDKKNIESLAKKNDVYTKEETYSKKEVYNKGEIDEKFNYNNSGVSIVGGANNLSELLDVKVTDPIQGQTLVYNDENKRWENGEGVGLSTTYSKLLELEGLSGTLTYNGNNQVTTITYPTCTVVNTYNSNNQIATTVYTFADATVITMTATYTSTTLTGFTYS